MSSDETSQRVADLTAKFDAIVGIDITAQLVRSGELGKVFSFDKFRSSFEDVINYVTRLRRLDWTLLTTTQLDSVINQAEAVRGALEAIINFNPDQQPNPAATRDNLGERVQAQFAALREQTIPLVGFLSWQSVDLDAMTHEIDRIVTSANDRIADAIGELSKKQDESDRILSAMREHASAAGVAGESVVFKIAADDHMNSSWKWLAASIVTAVATVATAVGLVLLWDINGNISEASNLQVVLAKGTILLVGFFVTANLLRVYRAQAHLAVVNRHREHALTTFRTFVEGTDDETVRNQVLLEATHAIFGQVPSGLIDDRNSDLEILDAVGGSILRR